MNKYLEKFRIKLEDLLVESEVTISDRIDLDGITIFKLSGTSALYNVSELLEGLDKFINESGNDWMNPYNGFKFYMNSLSNVIIVLYNASETNQLSLSYLLNDNNADIDVITDNISMIPENKLIEVLEIKPPEKLNVDPTDKQVIESMRKTESLYNYVQLCDKLAEKFGEVTDSLEVFMDPKYGRLWCADSGCTKLFDNILRTVYLYTEKEPDEISLNEISKEISNSSKYFNWHMRKTQVERNGKFTIALSFGNKDDIQDESQSELLVTDTEDVIESKLSKWIKDSSEEYQYKLNIDNIPYNIKYKPNVVNDKLFIITDEPIKLELPLKQLDFQIKEEYVNTYSINPDVKILHDLKSRIINPINDYIDLKSYNDESLHSIIKIANDLNDQVNEYLNKDWSTRDFYNGVRLHNELYKFSKFIKTIDKCINEDTDLNDLITGNKNKLNELDEFLHTRYRCVFDNRITEFNYEIDLE